MAWPALLITLLLALSGCGGDLQSDAEREAGLKIYRHSMNGVPTTLDPAQASSVYSSFIIDNVYDTLYTYKYLARPYELKPDLALALPEISADKRTYTIRLKPGIRFADDPAFPGGKGREVVAADFVYSLKRQFDPNNKPRGAWLWAGRIAGLDAWKDAGSDYSVAVEGLRALDSHTVQITLTRPYPQLLYTLAMSSAAVVPREAVEFYGREFPINPVGSGPFRLQSFNSTKVVLVKNPGFRQEPVDLEYEGYDPDTQAATGVASIDGQVPPFLDRLEIHFIKESSARWSSFTKGNEIQFSPIPNEQVDRVLASKRPVRLKPYFDDRYHYMSGVEAGFVYAAFNMDFPEIGFNPDPERERRNKALRCAIIKAVSWEQRNESFYVGLGVIFPGVITPAVPEFDVTLSRDSVTRDVAGARQLLADNGWTAETLPELVYGSAPGATSRLFFEQFRAWLKEIGYPQEKLVLKTYANFGDLSKAWKNSELPLVTSGWKLDYPDAENTLQMFYGPNRSPGANSGNYKNPEFDRLYDKSSVLLPSPERTEIYRRMNRIVIDDCAAISGLSRTAISLWHKDVIAVPDSSFLSGGFTRFVDIRIPGTGRT